MKTYKQLIGDAFIKCGLGSLGGGFMVALIKDSNYAAFLIALIAGTLLIHFGAVLAQEPKDNVE